MSSSHAALDVFTGSTAAHVGDIDKSSSTGGCSVADNKTNMVNVILTRVLSHKILYTTVGSGVVWLLLGLWVLPRGPRNCTQP